MNSPVDTQDQYIDDAKQIKIKVRERSGTTRPIVVRELDSTLFHGRQGR
jgi:hypothetical protein